MSSNFDRGVLVRLIRPESEEHARIYRASSWHDEEEGVEECATADELIAHGERTGAFPVSVDTAPAATMVNGRWIAAERDRVVVAQYANHDPRIVGTCKGRWTDMGRDNWRSLIRAAVDAGARPAGGFSLDDGRKLCATFETDRGVAGAAGQILSHLTFCDSLDGSGHMLVIQSSNRSVCCNTVSLNKAEAGREGALLQARHTRSIRSKVRSISEVLHEAVQNARTIREKFAERAERKITRDDFDALTDRLFPRAPEGASAHLRTRLENERADFVRACARAENNLGQTVATLQNGATWLVDREANGSARLPRGGGSPLGAMLTGGWGDRVQEIETIIEVFMRDGSVKQIPASEALQTPGISPEVVGRAVLNDILGGDIWS